MKKTIIIIITLLIVLSCSKENPFNTSTFSQESFEKWLAKNDPQAQPFKDKNGNIDHSVYIRYVERGAVVDSLKLVEYAWFEANYTGRMLNGTFFTTRDSTTSRIVGQWKNTTHWVPDFLQVYESNGFFSPGLYSVIQTLHPGDSLRIYLEGKQAYFGAAMSMNSGYYGETSDYIGFPIYLDIRIKSATYAPAWREHRIVEKFAKDNWNFSPKDTLASGLYMKLTKVKPLADTIGKDTIIEMHYTQRFLDGFMISTTNDSIAKLENRYNPTQGTTAGETYGALRLMPGSTNTLPKAIVKALLKMRKGESAEVVTVSKWTLQGNGGKFSDTPQILPYQPVKYIVEVADTVSNSI